MVYGTFLGLCLVIVFCFFTYSLGRKMEFMTEQLVKNRSTTINNIHIYGNMNRQQLEQIANKCDIAFLKPPLLEGNELSAPGINEGLKKEMNLDEKRNLEDPFVEVDLGESEKELIQFLQKNGEENSALENEGSNLVEVDFGESERELIQFLQQNEPIANESPSEFTEKLWLEWKVPEQYRPLPSLTILHHEKRSVDSCLGKIYAKEKRDDGHSYVLFGDTNTKKWFKVNASISNSTIPVNRIGYCDIDDKTINKIFILKQENLVELEAA